MAKKSTAKKPAKKNADIGEGSTLIADNRKARHRFEILDSLECGIVLTGSEVKSLRNGKLSLEEAYARVRDGEVWLVDCDIAQYPQATLWNHEPKRPRKLLLQQREIRKFANLAREKGLTLTPLKMYFTSRGVAKVLIGLCRGRKLHDKRETLKKADSQRDMQRAMRRGQGAEPQLRDPGIASASAVLRVLRG